MLYLRLLITSNRTFDYKQKAVTITFLAILIVIEKHVENFMQLAENENKASILIVDDAPQNIQVLSAFLQESGYKLYVAKTGGQAVKIATERLPDLILLDVVLPEMDGFRVCQILKSQPETADIPIIFITGLTDNENIIRGFELGGADYVTKPFDRHVLLARVKTHLLLYQRTRQLLQYSFVDGLTGLANRRRLEEFFDQEWRRCYRQRLPLSVVLCDVDSFKQYNDFYGHLAGDDVLKKIAVVLQRQARRPGDLAARYGGEEFILILGNTPPTAAHALAESFLNDVVDLNIRHEKTLVKNLTQITCSCGIYGEIPNAINVQRESFLEPADAALYRAKQQGRNQAIVFE